MRRHKVDFIAEVPQPTKVAFRTRDGENIRFIAMKPQKTEVIFYAKNKAKRSK
jgi:hypothetical protein